MAGTLATTAEEITAVLRDFFVAERTAATDAYLQAREPRAKLIGIVGFVMATMLTRSPHVLGGLASVVLVLALISSVPLSRLIRRLAVVSAATGLVVTPQLALQPGTPLIAVSGVTVTSGGIEYVLQFTVRVGIAVAFLSLLVMTTPFASLVAAARRFGLPVPIVWVLAITYRYLFLFFDELRRLLLARNSRTVTRDSLRREWRDARQVGGTFLLRAIERGESVGRAMRARGGTRPPSPYSRSESVDSGDCLLIAASVTTVVITGVIRWGF